MSATDLELAQRPWFASCCFECPKSLFEYVAGSGEGVCACQLLHYHLCLPYHGECTVVLQAWYGTMGIGAITHTLNPRLSDADIAYIAAHGNFQALGAWLSGPSQQQ
jgi:hypothetical protein